MPVLSGPNEGDYIFNPSHLYNPYYKNIDPRVGFADRLAPQTVIRGGFGIFDVQPITQSLEGTYGFFPSVSEQSEVIPQAQRTSAWVANGAFNIPGPAIYDTSGQLIVPGGPGSPQNRIMNGLLFGQQNPGLLLGTDANAGVLPSNFRDGRVMEWNLTLEHQLGQDILVSAAYVGNAGIDLLGLSEPFCAYGNDSAQCLALQQPWLSKDTAIPLIVDNSDHSTYHALQLEAKKSSAARGYAFSAAYTWAKNLGQNDSLFNIGNANDSGAGADPLDRRADKGPSNYDVRGLFSFSGIYAPPFSRWITPLPKRLSDGWRFVSSGVLRTGLPFTIFGAAGGNLFGGGSRPDLLANPETMYAPPGSDPTQYFSNTVIADAAGEYVCGNPLAKYFCGPAGQTGTMGRGLFRTRGFKDVAFSVIKDTSLTENVKLQFRTEVFNIFNFVNFDQPDANLMDPTFGRMLSTVATPNPPVTSRQIQFALKLIF